MRSSTLRKNIFISLLCAGLLCWHHAFADGPVRRNPYSRQDTTGGIVVRTEHNSELVVRERSGKERRFTQIDGDGPFDTIIHVNGHTVAFRAIKVGMRVQIVFYNAKRMTSPPLGRREHFALLVT
jgi:hypothetical protein